MYSFTKDGGEYILRIGHSLRRSIPLIQGEVDWINYLASGGAGVARAILSEAGALVEEIPDGWPAADGEAFLATAFVKAQGHAPRREDWTPAFYRTYGRLLGRIHALSRHYRPAPGCVRLHWDDPVNMHVEKLLSPTEGGALQHYQEIMDHLKSLPREGGGYGMIHQDAHSGNFFMDDAGQFTLFDFDDCCYSWFIYDIAMVLFYAAVWKSDPAAFTREFFPIFLQGYREENQLDPGWLVEMPYFLKLREIDLYAAIISSFDVDNIDDPWAAGYMKGRKERIEARLPYIDLDFIMFKPFLE